MSRKGENIRKRKDGRWEGRYIYSRDINGRANYHSVYAHSYTEVKKLLRTAESTISSTKILSGNIITFGDAAGRWLARCELNLKRSTVVKYSEQLNKHILPSFSDIRLSAMSEPIIAQFLKEKSVILSSSSLHTLLTIIKSITKYARQQGWSNANYSDLCLPTMTARKPETLNAVEHHRLESYLFDEMDLSKLGIYLCLYTGLRIGELCSLQWADIDLENNVLSVTSTVQRLKKDGSDFAQKTELSISEPKSRASLRSIPLPSQLVSVISPFRSSPDTFVLTGHARPMEPRTMQYRFKKYAQALGLSCSNVHSLRHTFATRCIELGFDAKTLSEILGHARVDITLNRYVHSSSEHKRSQMELLYENRGQKSGRSID